MLMSYALTLEVWLPTSAPSLITRSSSEVKPALEKMYAISPSAKVVPVATVTTPVDSLTALTTEPVCLSWPVADTSYCATASPILKFLAIEAGTVNVVVAPADVIIAEDASSSSLISFAWSVEACSASSANTSPTPPSNPLEKMDLTEAPKVVPTILGSELMVSMLEMSTVGRLPVSVTGRER